MSAPPPGYRVRTYDTLGSTNREALTLAREGVAGGLWVVAEEQREGRGRRGRTWETARGNLAASLLLLDPAPPEVAATLSFVAGVALHLAVVDLVGPAIAERLTLKWPNDLLLDRHKVGGILVEGERTAGSFVVVIGVGANCVDHPDIEARVPISDFAARGVDLVAELLFERLAQRMADEIVRWNRGAGFAETRGAWLARSIGVGEEIRVNLAHGSLDGRFEALDDDGRLILERHDGVRETISAGDVFFASAGPE